MNTTNEQTEQTGKKLDGNVQSGIVTGMTTKTKRTRRMNNTGCLISKGEGKPYLAKWSCNGKIMYRSTGESNYNRALRILDTWTKAQRETTTEGKIAMLEAQLATLRATLQNPELPVADLWTVYEGMQDWGNCTEQTKRGYERMIRALSDWMTRHGCRNVSDLTNEKALQLLKELQADPRCVEQSYNNRLSQFKKVWKTIAPKYHVQADAWKGRKYLKGAKESHKKPFTFAEVRQLIAEADEDMRLLCLLGAYCGMRKEDCAKLKWADVDMEAKTLRVTPVKTKKHGNKVTLTIAPELYEALVKARQTATGEYVSERNAHGRVGERFGKLLDKCGIKRTEKDDKGRTRSVKSFHSFRHFTASALYAMGVSKAVIAQVLGDSEKMMDTYISVDFGCKLAA